MTPLGKGIGDSLVAFGLSRQIVKHKQIHFTGIYIFRAIQIIGDTAHKFYPQYSTPNVVVKRLPLSKTPFDMLRWWLYEKRNFQVHSDFPLPLGTGTTTRKRMLKGNTFEIVRVGRLFGPVVTSVYIAMVSSHGVAPTEGLVTNWTPIHFYLRESFCSSFLRCLDERWRWWCWW